MGTADRVVFTDLNVDEVTLDYEDYRGDYPSEGLALMIQWSNAQGSGQLQIANEGRNIEAFQFADGSVFTATQLLARISGNAVSVPAIPQVQPVLAEEKFAVGPEVLPTAPGDFTKEGGEEVLPAMSDDWVKFEAPQVLPGEATDVTTPGRDQLRGVDYASRNDDTAETLLMFDGSADDGYLFVGMTDAGPPEALPAIADDFILFTKEGGEEVLPAMSDDWVKFEAPQVLPGEATDVTTPGRDQLRGVDYASRNDDTAETLLMFDGSADGGYLFFGMTDAGSPEVLPAIADDFILTAKFEGPPVMPTADVDFDVAGLVKDIEFAQGLLFSGGGNSSNPNVSADGLTVYEDWSAFAPPTRHDVWG
jgi:hypothetical protein